VTRRVAAISAGVALTAALGLGLAGREAPPASPTRSASTDTAAPPAPSTEPAPPASAPSPTRRSLESALSGSARAKVAPGETPLDRILRLIDRLSRDELLAVLAEVTGRDREALEELRNPQATAHALATALLSGWGTEPVTVAPQPIGFSTELSRPPGESFFRSATTRIFGTFPMEPGEQIDVLAKWYRVEPHEFLLVEEVPVQERNGRGFVRLERSNGWPAGRYRLELYESSESVEPLASGEYQTYGNRLPNRVVFN